MPGPTLSIRQGHSPQRRRERRGEDPTRRIAPLLLSAFCVLPAAFCLQRMGVGFRSSPRLTYTTWASVTSTFSLTLRSDSTVTFTVIEVVPMRTVSVQKLTRSPTKTGSWKTILSIDTVTMKGCPGGALQSRRPGRLRGDRGL